MIGCTISMWKKVGFMENETKQLIIGDLKIETSWKLPSHDHLILTVDCDDKRVTKETSILPPVFDCFIQIFTQFEPKLSQLRENVYFYQ